MSDESDIPNEFGDVYLSNEYEAKSSEDLVSSKNSRFEASIGNQCYSTSSLICYYEIGEFVEEQCDEIDDPLTFYCCKVIFEEHIPWCAKYLIHAEASVEDFPMEIYAIADGVVLPYILDPNFEKYLPTIPAEVVKVNFTWKSGDQKYYYDFDQLKSFNETILSDPLISIETKGKVPRKSRIFQVILPCLRNQSGVASFGISLKIENDKGTYLPGTPLRLKLKKQCGDHGPDPECDKKCANGGRCNQHGICQCPKGYRGKIVRS
ncbi:Protein shifted, partial [Araneus ventricosus]